MKINKVIFSFLLNLENRKEEFIKNTSILQILSFFTKTLQIYYSIDAC